MASVAQNQNGSEPIVIADHPALDLLNTLPCIDGQLVDFLQSDSDVRRWMERIGFSVPNCLDSSIPQGLAETARELREIFRDLVKRRKAGEELDLSAMNAFLTHASSYPRLVWAKTTNLQLERVRPCNTAEEFLGPVAEAAAKLLTEGDFDLIKRCEDGQCVLWFYDQTKSHHRRWCSMATCGNRNKVAAYRKRQHS
jgi:predicted RNA-binding Zn ribbon-like protein